MPFEVNTGTSADPLDGTEKLPVSQSNLPRVVTTNEFFYLNAFNRMFTDKTVNIDNGTGGALFFGDGTGLTIASVDGVSASLSVPGAVQFDINADQGAIKNNAGSTTHLAWSSSGVTATFQNGTNSGVLIYDTDGSHKMRFAVGSNLTANRTFTMTTGNADRTLDISAGSVTITAAGNALTSAADLAAQKTLLGIGTADSPEFTGINVGHASDTTITRASAGDIAVEGNTVYRAGGTDVPVTDGGTGRSTGTTAYALIATGTTATGAQQSLAAGATTEILVGGGASALPVWTTATGTGAPVRAGSPTLTGTVTAAAINASGLVDVASSARVTGVNAPGSGSGMEMYFESDEGKILAFARTGGLYKNMNIIGLNVRLNVSGTNILVASSTGAAVTGLVSASTWLKSGSYTVGTVPSAATAGAGAQIYVSNETGGAVVAFSDATNWRRVTDRAIVS